MVFNAIFNNISALSWRSVLLVEDNPYFKSLYHIMLLRVYFGMIRTDYLAQNLNNVSEWSDMSTHRLLIQWNNTMQIQLSVLD